MSPRAVRSNRLGSLYGAPGGTAIPQPTADSSVAEPARSGAWVASPAVTSTTWRQVTAWRLGRLHLTRRVSTARMVTVVEDLCGAHAQISSSVPLALAARVSNLTQGDVDRAIADERTLVKTWAMRGTLHVLAAGDLPLYCAAQRTRDQYQNPSFLKYFGLERADVDAVLDAIPQALDGQALSRDELARSILRITKRRHLEKRLLSGWGEMLKPAAFRGLLCFGPQSAGKVTFVRPDQWIGGWKDFDTDDALVEVFRRFLARYGPASRTELARWWGVRPPEAGRILKLMEDSLVEVMVDGDGTKRWMLRRDVAGLERATPPSGVRLLPSFDQLLVMSAPHSQAIVDPKFKSKIYRDRIAVWSLPTVLVDGRARAAWKVERKSKKAVVKVAPFEKLSRTASAGIEAEAGTLAVLLGTDVDVVVG